MKEFGAVHLDLELELTELSGEVRRLSPPENLQFTAAYIGSVMKNMRDMEEIFNSENDEGFTAGDLLAGELALVYIGEKDYFINNFDIGTLREIVSFVVTAFGGYQKN